MNSRRIRAAMRGGAGRAAASALPFRQGTRMQVPGYPSNREADDRAGMPLRTRAEGGVSPPLFPSPWEGAPVG